MGREKIVKTAAFWGGITAVSLGVVLHLPMFIEAAECNYHMAGMPMDTPMLIGMFLILLGTVGAGYGLLPAGMGKAAAKQPFLETAQEEQSSRETLTFAHWQLLLVLVMALIIDTMKPITLGFVIPGTLEEYGLTKPQVALLPFSGLTGTTLGSYIWGVLADRLGRRAAILLAGIMFIGTSICGAMPSYEWNLAMCFVMGLAAGGMLPIAYTLLTETFPVRHRGWSLVLMGGLAMVGGYFAASGAARLLEPHFGWRILWLVGLPTGLLLILFNRFIPESPQFLLMQGRNDEARAIMKRFRMPAATGWSDVAASTELRAETGRALFRKPLLERTIILNLTALAWGLVNFGLVLWLPAELRERGFSVAGSDALLFQSAVIALPTTFVTAWLYSRWSSKGTLAAALVVTGAGLILVWLLGVSSLQIEPVICFGVLFTGVNAIIAVLLPYTAESYPLYIRGRGTGMVAATSKSGGIVAQAVAMAALIPELSLAALMLAAPIACSALLVSYKSKKAAAPIPVRRD